MSDGLLRATAGAARRRLSPRARRLARGAIWSWGRATARWREVPQVVVVGAQRSGTTTLFRMLADHPQLMRPTVSKGTGYFDDHYARGPRWYAAHFPLRLSLRLAGRGRAMRTFECSGYYLFHPLAAERLARDLPRAQVVVMLRDPVARAHSAHRHEFSRGFETLGFAEALAAESRRTAGEVDRLVRTPGATSPALRHHAYLGRSSYRGQVERLLAAVGPERVHVVEAERLFADPVGEFDRLQDALGLTRVPTAVLTAWNAEPGDPIEDELSDELRERFAVDDQWLAELLGHVPAWREED